MALGNKWQDRWLRREMVAPEQLLANPENYKVHPRYQQDLMRRAFEQVGWIDAVSVNVNTGHVWDGHMRVLLAMEEGEAAVPVDYYDLTLEQERVALATYDPLGALIVTDRTKLEELLAGTAEQARALITDLQHRLDQERPTPVLERYAPDYRADDLLGGFSQEVRDRAGVMEVTFTLPREDGERIQKAIRRDGMDVWGPRVIDLFESFDLEEQEAA